MCIYAIFCLPRFPCQKVEFDIGLEFCCLFALSLLYFILLMQSILDSVYYTLNVHDKLGEAANYQNIIDLVLL